MRALSLWQPWATLLILGVKRWETRSWATKYRGPVAIHAAQKRDVNARELVQRAPAFYEPLRAAGYPTLNHLPFGMVLGIVEFKECLLTDRALREGLITAQQIPYGDFSPGRYCIDCSVVERFVQPIPYKGAQGFFNFERTP